MVLLNLDVSIVAIFWFCLNLNTSSLKILSKEQLLLSKWPFYKYAKVQNVTKKSHLMAITILVNIFSLSTIPDACQFLQLMWNQVELTKWY